MTPGGTGGSEIMPLDSSLGEIAKKVSKKKKNKGKRKKPSYNGKSNRLSLPEAACEG